MSSEDKIIIDGVEYERPGEYEPVSGIVYIPLRPKRKQTGWICRFCEPDFCVGIHHIDSSMIVPSFCPCDRACREWLPFYGKVVE